MNSSTVGRHNPPLLEFAPVRRVFGRILVAALLPSGLACAARPAPVPVIEPVRAVRVPGPDEVAVIGDRRILLSELRSRARPFLVEIARRMPPGPQRAATEAQIFKDLLERMIEDELERLAADEAHVWVTADEIDNVLRNIADAQGLTVPELVRNAQRSGLSEQEYRDELRRQLLEGKMLALRVEEPMRITEEDVKAMYERTLREERKRREYRARWIVLSVLSGSSSPAVARREQRAHELARRARLGEDFGSLAKKYSDDPPTRDRGGDLGIRAPQGSPQALAGKRDPLRPELDGVVATLEPGQVSDPIDIEEAIVVLQLVDRQASRYVTGYEAAKSEMRQRLQTEILVKAKHMWIEELKSGTHVEVRF
jgi:peptidyl-prolyl cis-trans isomerase SurA